MKPEEQPKVPQELVNELIEKLEGESDADWTGEFGASGSKTTPGP